MKLSIQSFKGIAPRLNPRYLPEGGAQVALNLINRRLEFLRGLSKWKTFGRGWSHRVAALREIVTA